MTDLQILTAGIAIVVPVSSLIVSYFMSSKLVEQIGKQIEVQSKMFEAKLDTLRSDMSAGFQALEYQIEKHDWSTTDEASPERSR